MSQTPNALLLPFWDTVINRVEPGEEYSNYDNKALKDWGVDDFASYVFGHCTANDILTVENMSPLLKAIFGEKEFDLTTLTDKGSGYNDNTNYRMYGSWKSAMYDMWDELTGTPHKAFNMPDAYLKQEYEEGTVVRGKHSNFSLIVHWLMYQPWVLNGRKAKLYLPIAAKWATDKSPYLVNDRGQRYDFTQAQCLKIWFNQGGKLSRVNVTKNEENLGIHNGIENNSVTR